DGPMNAVTAFGGMTRLTSRTARLSPYQTATSRISSLVAASVGTGFGADSTTVAARARAAASAASVEPTPAPDVGVIGGETTVMASSGTVSDMVGIRSR